MELEQDLRTASDGVLRALERLEALETEKRTLKPGTERFQHLAAEIERLAATVFAQTHAQKKLAEKSKVASDRAEADPSPIDEVTPARDLPTVLAEWRAAERRLAATEPDTAEHALAATDVERLRDEYRRTYTGGDQPANKS